MAYFANLPCWVILSILVTSVCSTAPQGSAWNGQVTPQSLKPSRFTPYYVPPGAKGYDSTSPLIHYSGEWSEKFSPQYIGASISRTTVLGAFVSFTFRGTGIEWFGCLDNAHGEADVYIDGKHVRKVDTRSSRSLNQQRIFWEYDLPNGKHTIKIVNVGHRKQPARLDIDSFVVTQGAQNSPKTRHSVRNLSRFTHRAPAAASSSEWTMVQKGSTGVNAMQLAIISDSQAMLIDKVQHNPLTIDGRPAWATLYNLKTHVLKPLHMQSNSFCAGGAFLSNGTLINVGGNPVVEDQTSAADFGDFNGMQSIRILEPCKSESGSACVIWEDPKRIRMASPRWYNTVLRISDGSAMIIGGSKKGGWMNNATTNNPTVEYFPPKMIHGSQGLPIALSFLTDTLNANLFPIAFALPDDTIFIAANRDAMIYDWRRNKERRLPRIPNGVRVTYPMAGTGVLLPLVPENNYAPEVLLCGGSTLDDKKPPGMLSARDAASSQCVRMLLTEEGIAAGWVVEQMPGPRLMGDSVLLPTGQVLLVNGAGSGISGYGNVLDQVGASNADNPVLQPVLYDPNKPLGERFSQEGMPTSHIPRLYHSVATLTPFGDIMIAGSNPNLDRSEIMYGTEYRVEWLQPPYTKLQRPVIKENWGEGGKKKIGFGKTVLMEVDIPSALVGKDIKVVIMDLGFVTHAVHSNSRSVYLKTGLSADAKTLSITGPPNSNVYPPGPAWIYVVVNGVPSSGVKIMVGSGAGPEVDEAALKNLLENTSADQEM